MTPKERIAELRKVVGACTPGPWRTAFNEAVGENWHVIYGSFGGISEIVSTPLAGPVGCELDKANVEFIAASRTTVPALLDALEKSVEALEWYSERGRFTEGLDWDVDERGGVTKLGKISRAALAAAKERGEKDG